VVVGAAVVVGAVVAAVVVRSVVDLPVVPVCVRVCWVCCVRVVLVVGSESWVELVCRLF
jgi:hypothetical protein